MTTKAKTAEVQAENPVLYDSNADQAIPLNLEKNGREFRVIHRVGPLSTDRYFAYMRSVEQLTVRLKKITTGILDPQYQVWKDIVTAREGYKDRPDWKDATHANDAVAAVAALMHVQVLENDESELQESDGIYDEDELTVIQFRALQSGVLMTLSHSFREETKKEADEFLAIETDQPIDGKLASAEKLSKAEKLFELGSKLLKDRTGYADGSDVPPWHLAATAEAFFARQSARLGKFLMQ
jgi:hypothetical protein